MGTFRERYRDCAWADVRSSYVFADSHLHQRNQWKLLDHWTMSPGRQSPDTGSSDRSGLGPFRWPLRNLVARSNNHDASSRDRVAIIWPAEATEEATAGGDINALGCFIEEWPLWVAGSRRVVGRTAGPAVTCRSLCPLPAKDRAGLFSRVSLSRFVDRMRTRNDAW
jgi:hypothetical protein